MPPSIGFVDRGSVSIRLTEWAEHDPLRTASSVYLYVSDADALYAEWEALENLEGAVGRAPRHALPVKRIRVRRPRRHPAPDRVATGRVISPAISHLKVTHWLVAV
jgi:hypothetical protein